MPAPVCVFVYCTAKQVRERWNNHLNPTLKTGPFTPDEDLLLEQAVSDLGTHWIEVARRVPGRSEVRIRRI